MGSSLTRALYSAALVAVLGVGAAGAGEDEVRSRGLRVAIDPDSGEFVAAPAPLPFDGGGAAQRLDDADRTDDLIEEVNPAGGYTIHLRRRFGGVARAQVTSAGVSVECDAGDAAHHAHQPTRELRTVAGPDKAASGDRCPQGEHDAGR